MSTEAHIETPRGHYVEVNGLNIYYEEYGEGPPLILIHGGILTAQSWEPYIPTFAQHFRVIAPDTRGHGRTNNPTGEMSFELLAADVAALAHALSLHKPLIFGYSDGGQAALEIGMSYPDIPGAIVVGGAHLELTDGSRNWVRSILGHENDPEVDLDKFERENPGFAADLQQMQGDHWRTLLTQIKSMWLSPLNYTAEEFARVTMPTLVVVGDRDGFVPAEDGIALYRRLPNAEIAVIPNADHSKLIFSRETISIAQPLILDFLRRNCGLVAMEPNQS